MAFDEIREKLFGAIQGSKINDNDQGLYEQDLISFVRGKVEDVRSNASRVSHEGIWLTNIAYLLGFDSMFYDTNIRQFRPINGQFMRRRRISVNRILPTCQNRAARLCKNPPRYDVRPKSTSEEDREAARLGQYLITQIWDQQKINKKRLELIMWVQQCGHAYLKTCWDKTLGPKMPITDPTTGQVRLEPLGDIRVDVVNSFEMFPDPLAKSFEELGWLCQAKIRPISYFREQYGEKGALVKPEDVWLTSLQYENRVNTFNNQAGASSSTNSVIKHAAIELSYYEKPSYRHPHGRMVITANGILLEDKELPIDELPYAKFDDVMVAGKFYPESIITHMRPIQDQYNTTISQRAEWVNKLLTGKYLAARGHGLMESALNDQSGEVVEYDPVPNASPPSPMQSPILPQYAYQEDDSLTSMMDNISGLSEPSQGELPSAGIPAVGLQYLIEQDLTRMGVVIEQHEFAYADVGRHILKFAEKGYESPRLLKISGSGMDYAVKSFLGAQINGNNDVIVIRGSSLPSSKVLKRQEIINLHQQGYLGDPADPQVRERVLNMLEYGDIQEPWKRRSLTMAQIKKHITMIEQEIRPPVSEFDNHGLFIQELDTYRLSDKFDNLSDVSKSLLLECMESHLQELTNMNLPPSGPDNPDMQTSTSAQEAEDQLKAGFNETGVEEEQQFTPQMEG